MIRQLQNTMFRRARPGWQVFVLLCTILLMAEQSARHVDAQDVKPESLSVSAISVSSQGELCPQGSIGLSNSSKSIVTLLFDAAQLTGDKESSAVSKSCEAVLPLEILDGYRVAEPKICISYDVAIPEGAVGVPEIALGLGFLGGSQVWMKRKPKAARHECLTLPLPASSSCGDMPAPQLVLSIEESAPPGLLVVVDEVSFNFDYYGGARWLSCAEAPLPGPAGFHENCRGRNERSCGQELECRRPTTLDGVPIGTCVRPCEHIALAAESCGGSGFDEVLCQVGLDCVRRDGEDLGVCEAP